MDSLGFELLVDKTWREGMRWSRGKAIGSRRTGRAWYSRSLSNLAELARQTAREIAEGTAAILLGIRSAYIGVCSHADASALIHARVPNFYPTYLIRRFRKRNSAEYVPQQQRFSGKASRSALLLCPWTVRERWCPTT